MKRKAIDRIIKWKQEPESKPLLLTGAKGVGKTYVAYDFAKSFYNHILYLNLERDPNVRELFIPDTTDRIADKLLSYFQLAEEDEISDRILILDEIVFCPDAFECLASLCNSRKFPKVIAITSLPLPEEYLNSFYILPIAPLEFDEFLLATANDWYIEAIVTHFESNKPLPEIVHKELLTLHELYMKLGGMPGAINEYLNFMTLANIPEQHSLILGSYHDYILKIFQDSDALKMNQVLDSLTQQLMKPNKKFQYKLIRKGTTHGMYKDAIQKLLDCNYILQCHKIKSEQLISESFPHTYTQQAFNTPGSTEAEELSKGDTGTNFKLYLPDTGLLSTSITEEKYLFSDPVVRKAVLENYVAQAFHAKGYPLIFWESESMAKIEFILLKRDHFIPVEVHIDENTRSKSISVLKQKQAFPYAVKITSKNFEYANQVKYVPYYAVFCL